MGHVAMHGYIAGNIAVCGLHIGFHSSVWVKQFKLYCKFQIGTAIVSHYIQYSRTIVTNNNHIQLSQTIRTFFNHIKY